MTVYFTKFMLVFLLGIISSSSYSLNGFENYKTISLRSQCDLNGDISDHSQTLQLASMSDPKIKKSAFVLLAEIDHSHSTKSFRCTFTVKAAPGEHIYATIQSMTFESRPNSRCKDYIKFSDKSEWARHRSFCGKHQRKNALSLYQSSKYENFNDSKVVPESKHLSFDAENDELQVEIFISRNNINKNLQNNLVVTFTPYKRKAKLSSKYKINKIYQCDGIENCNGFKCHDEDDCGINGFTVFFIIMPVFLAVIVAAKVYELWKNGKLCCNRAGINASESTVNLPNNIFFIEPENHFNVLPSPSTLPSYESLFPNQSTTSLNTNGNTTTSPQIVTNLTAENSQIDATYNI